ncbi:MAG: hypothetical protein WBO36_15555 [Saprospiraceae bacterium]
MYNIAKVKYNTYVNKERMEKTDIQTEIENTKFRIRKKNINRRRYVWMVVICCAIAFFGIFSSYKSILMGTSIPIALIAAIEFSIGLLTEFRLREFLRVLTRGDQ